MAIKYVLFLFLSTNIFSNQFNINLNFTRDFNEKEAFIHWIKDKGIDAEFILMVESTLLNFQHPHWFRFYKVLDVRMKGVKLTENCKLINFSGVVFPPPFYSSITFNIEGKKNHCHHLIDELKRNKLEFKVPDVEFMNSTIKVDTIKLKILESID